MRNEVITATLAGLLHDIGKFAQQSGAFVGTHAEVDAQLIESWRDLLPVYAMEDVMNAVAGHHDKRHPPQKRIEKIVQITDRLRNGKQSFEAVSRSNLKNTSLVPILSQVVLTSTIPEQSWRYDLNALSTNRTTLFPKNTPENISAERYAHHWEAFAGEIKLLMRSGPIDNDLRLVTLLTLFRKYLWCVPAATPGPISDAERTSPDVSLYDDIKVTAALTTCLEVGLSDNELEDLYQKGAKWPAPIAIMMRGDISGIQNFIYRITRPDSEAEFENVAKRLRGRSFYLSLLGDVIVDWIIRRLELSAANILFLGGGRFDLLLPVGTKVTHILQEIKATLEQWLLQQFMGDLGVQIAMAEVRPTDLSDMRCIYDQLEAKLQAGKQRKWGDFLLHQDFHESEVEEYHACRVCHTTSLQNPGICALCEQHAKLGQQLPHATHLAMLYDDQPAAEGLWLYDFQEIMRVRIGVLDDKDVTALYQRLSRKEGRVTAMIYRLNDTAFLRENAPRGIGMSFRFLANAAPLAAQPFNIKGSQPVAAHDVLHFEAIAHLSTGSQRIGVLKADVDRLGLLMSEGLHDGETKRMQPTISRLAALSSAVELFFGGWLNEMCDDVTQAWKVAQRGRPLDESHGADSVEGLFYVMYSGGDDLLIVGPWDAILTLAKHLQEGWAAYTCQNPNVTLSAGIAIVKPRYPVQRFVQEANTALEEAKGAGRNRVGVFGRVVGWTEASYGYVTLLDLGHDLVNELHTGEVPRTLIHDLGRLERQHRDDVRQGPLKPMFTPRLYYTLARRLKKEARERLTKRLLVAMPEIQIPVSYVSLATRKE